MAHRVRTLVGFVSLSLLMVGCDDNPDTPPMHTIGGTVSGLSGAGFTLQNGLGGVITLAPGATTFTFSPLPEGTDYQVTVRAQPIAPGQACTVTNGVGAVGTEAVTNISVTCARTTDRFAYVTNPAGQSIAIYSIGESGLLSPVSGFGMANFAPTAMVFEPTKRWGYIATGDAAAIGIVSVNEDNGGLTLLGAEPTGVGVFKLAMDPAGRFLYSSSHLGEVRAFTIVPDTGGLYPVAGSPFLIGGSGRELKVDPTGRFLYVANETLGAVNAFAIDQTTGALTPLAGSPFAAVPVSRGIEIDPAGERLYSVSHESGQIAAFTLDGATGALTPLPGSPFTGSTTSACAMAINPAATFAFVPNALQNGTLTTFSIADDGALTQQGTPVATGQYPCSVTVDSTGGFVYVANPGSASVAGFSINATTGALTVLTGSPFAAGNGADSITIR